METPEHGHEDDLARERPEEDVRRREPVQRDPQRAGNPGEDARDQKRDQPILADLDTHEAGPRLVVANRLERLAERRVHDDPHHQKAHHENGEHVVVIGVGQKVGLVFVAGEGDAEEGWGGDPKPKSKLKAKDATIVPRRYSSIDWMCRYLTMNATT